MSGPGPGEDGRPLPDGETDLDLRPAPRLLSAVLGGVGGGAGSVAVFTTDNEIGSSALLAVGVYFLMTAITGRFPRFKLGDNEIDPSLRRTVLQARRTSERAEEDAQDAKEALREMLGPRGGPRSPSGSAAPGRPGVDERIGRLAAEYDRVRWTMQSGEARTQRMTKIVEDMIAVFRTEEGGASPEQAVALMRSPDRGLRLAGVAAAYARPSAAAVPALVGVATTPDKPFNEYWALRTLRAVLAEGHCPALVAGLRDRLRERGAELGPQSDRARGIEAILRMCR